MKFCNDEIILDENEIKAWSTLLGGEIVGIYPAYTFVEMLHDNKLYALSEIERYRTKSEPKSGDEVRIELIQMLVDLCDSFADRAHKAAAEAGRSIALN